MKKETIYNVKLTAQQLRTLRIAVWTMRVEETEKERA